MCRAPSPPVAQILKGFAVSRSTRSRPPTSPTFARALGLHCAFKAQVFNFVAFRHLCFGSCKVKPRMPIVPSRRPERQEPPHQLGGQPVTLSRPPSKMAARPPEFGEQTEEVLAEFGFTKDEIAELRQRKVVSYRPPLLADAVATGLRGRSSTMRGRLGYAKKPRPDSALEPSHFAPVKLAGSRWGCQSFFKAFI
jgi:hypothetical protein